MKKRILVIGDSHSQAIGPRIKEAFNRDDVTVFAKPGYSTARIAAALTPELTDVPYDLAIVIAGGNDFGDRSVSRLELLRRLHKSKQVLWVGPAYSRKAEVDARHALQSDSQQVQFSKLRVPWIDSYPWTKENHASDGVHFTAKGYDTWAATIIDEANWLLKRRTFRVVVAWTAIVGVVVAIFRKTLNLK